MCSRSCCCCKILTRDATALPLRRVPLQFDLLVSSLHCCSVSGGRILVSGVGKSGIVARRMAASLASTGTPSHFVHAGEWIHGDLGAARAGDAALFFSHSGSTRECVVACEFLKKRSSVAILSIVGSSASPLASLSDASVSYEYPVHDSAMREPLGCVPTTSLILQEAVCNAVACALIEAHAFSEYDFSVNHPGGAIGESFEHASEEKDKK